MNDPTRLVGEVAAILSIGAGVIHYSAAGDHTNLPVMFAGFIVVATLQVALGALLLWRRQPSRRLVLAGLALMLGSIGVWLLSRTAGLPFLEDGHAEPIGFKDGVTVLFELASIPPLLLLLSRDLARVALPSPRLEAQTLTALGASCFALMIPALVLDGGGHHSHEQAVEMGIHDDDHGAGDEVAHADRAAHDDPDGADHATKADGKGSGGHGHASANGSSGHHSGVELASTPLGTSHEHEGDTDGGDAPEHHADGEGEGNHRDGDHRRDRPGRDRGHGDHENEEPGDGSGDEPPVSVTYDPEPSVCITTVCVP